MSSSEALETSNIRESTREVNIDQAPSLPFRRKGPHRELTPNPAILDALLMVEDVGRRLYVSKDWVLDHCSCKKPQLPVIRMGCVALPSRAIEEFINEHKRLPSKRLARR